MIIMVSLFQILMFVNVYAMSIKKTVCMCSGWKSIVHRIMNCEKRCDVNAVALSSDIWIG